MSLSMYARTHTSVSYPSLLGGSRNNYVPVAVVQPCIQIFLFLNTISTSKWLLRKIVALGLEQERFK